MNFFKTILLIVALFSLDALNARVISTAPQPTPSAPQQQAIPPRIIKQPVVQQPQLQQPLPQAQSYKNLVTYVKNASNVWDNANGRLRTDFVNTIIQKARAARLDAFQLEALLQTARDVHGIFSGNQTRDIAILQAVDNQTKTAIK